MRVFSTKSMWDIKEQKWYEVYFVDENEVTPDEYFRELGIEQERQLDNLDNEDENYCQCCNCDVEDCPDFNCTCDEDSNDEELEDWKKQIVDIVESFADRIECDDLCDCGCDLRNILAELFYTARQIGFEDGIECGVESVEEKTVNISIDNLTVNANNTEEFFTQLKKRARLN